MAKIQITIPNWLDRICAWPAMEYRRRKYGYPYRRIYLGEGEFTIVDPKDFYWLNKFNWCLIDQGLQRYARRVFLDPIGGIKTVSMHREIMKSPSGLLIDHRNTDGLDNRRANLRPATRSQNCYNRRKTKSKTSSRFIGVCFLKRQNKWAANINYQKNNKYLGIYVNEIDAARAYDEAAKKYHGEFAKLNFPKDIERSPKPRGIQGIPGT
jgi:hypothetical protein